MCKENTCKYFILFEHWPSEKKMYTKYSDFLVLIPVYESKTKYYGYIDFFFLLKKLRTHWLYSTRSRSLLGTAEMIYYCIANTGNLHVHI